MAPVPQALTCNISTEMFHTRVLGVKPGTLVLSWREMNAIEMDLYEHDEADWDNIPVSTGEVEDGQENF